MTEREPNVTGWCREGRHPECKGTVFLPTDTADERVPCECECHRDDGPEALRELLRF